MRHQIQKLLDDTVNPQVAAHGGRIDLVDYANRTVYLRMSGGCQGCSASAATLRNGVEQTIRQHFPRVESVVDVTDHERGENPYYS